MHQGTSKGLTHPLNDRGGKEPGQKGVGQNTGDRAESSLVKGKISPMSYTAGPHGNGEDFLFLLNWALCQVKENIFPTPNGKMQGRHLK